jgi:hypothetical protein
MAVVVTLKPIRLNGTILQPGEKIRVEGEQELISRGYARRLTKEEARAILDEYIHYAEKIFGKSVPRDLGKKTAPRQRKIQVDQLSLFR